MTKQQYLDALQAALAGLPAEQVAKTLAYYEQRFVDAAAEGRSEESVAAELEEPRKIAITLRTNSHLHNLQQTPRPTPIRAVRTLFSAAGLAIFNLFMVVPGIVYASLVAALYVSAMAFYCSGIVVASSGLAGVNHLVINTPLRYVTHDDSEFASTQTHVSISSSGVNVDSIPVEEDDEPAGKRQWRRAERAAIGPVEISTDLEPGARTTQTLTGLALMIGGILLTLLSVVVTRFTLVGLRKYLDMNLALLRGQ